MKKPIVWDMNPKPKYKYLCPIGHKDSETKHFHKAHVKGMFQHDEILGYAVIHFTFIVNRGTQWLPESGDEKKYYNLISVNITGLGTGRKVKYHKKETSKKIGVVVKRLLRESHMVRE